jgi:hypothetical protein
MISCLLTSSTSPSQQRSARCERACEELGLHWQVASARGVNDDELQNIQAILPSSSSEILSER